LEKIVVIANPLRDDNAGSAMQVKECLTRQGFEVIVTMPTGLEDQAKRYPGTDRRSADECSEGASLVICMGGDGTILHAAQSAAVRDIPILGINMGTKGFMSGLEKNQLHLLEDFSLSKLVCERRLMLDVSLIRQGKVAYKKIALNDAVINKGVVSKMVNIQVSCANKEIMGFSGDGVVVCTPTGSTAYSMSAGGPIVEPEADNIIVTPISAHALHIQPRVLSGKRVVEVSLERIKRNRLAYLFVDGGPAVEIADGDVIKVEKSDYYTTIASLNGVDFFEKVENKLNSRLSFKEEDH